jgi:segregation and condensation protein A
VTAPQPEPASQAEPQSEPTAADAPVLASAGAFAPSGFQLRLDNFEGPFDLLLALISKRQLDVTEVALSQVTDEFIAYITAAGDDWDLGQATEFLVVASTLLDLKIARLLPSADVEQDEDLALLEARDLLFARVLQYRAYKLAAAHLAELEARQARRFMRRAELEPRFADLMPDVMIGVDPDRLAALAVQALTPKPPPTVGVDHIHAPRVSVSEHMAMLRVVLRRAGTATFRKLVEDCQSTLEVVARFLGLLELYREQAVAFDQADALGELHVRWIATDNGADSEGDSGDTGDSGDGGDGDGSDGENVGSDRAAAGARSDSAIDEEYG